ncbi:MAG: sulfatase-like hydrolase/transferase [Deferribacteres bacterium]|nr:sulfatase-like hydrolase/transferase [Deferribacteres bacterium]
MGSGKISCWQTFRPVFVLFSLFLLVDAFFRWDGFSYHSTLSEFIPSVALATILWTLTAVVTSVVLWLLLRALEGIYRRMGHKAGTEGFLLFAGILITGVFALYGASIWMNSKRILAILLTHETVLLSAITTASVFLAWLLRNKAAWLINIVQDRITPLVWLFGIWVIVAVPIVVYHTWVKETDSAVLQKAPASFTADADTQNRPNIILVIFDTLSARDMSVYGYDKPTTPFISRWAETASLFTRVVAASNYTTPTTASLMTGKRLWTHQTYQVEIASKPLKSDIESLPLMLKNNGYYNMAFIVNPAASLETLGITNSFEINYPQVIFSRPLTLFGIVNNSMYRLFDGKIKFHRWILGEGFVLCRLLCRFFKNFSKTELPPQLAFNKFLETLDNKPPEPFFAWIHLMPPHDPYLPPEPYMGKFNPSPELRSYKSQHNVGDFRKLYYPQEIQPTVNILRDRYDEFISYCDKQFENFIAQLEKRGKLKNTIVILSSDHGESFEHNYLRHGGLHLYEEVTHIPLIVKEPGQSKGQVIDDIVEQIDIPATILDLAAVPVPSWMEGRSLVPLMRDKKLPSRPALSMSLERNRVRDPITKGTIAIWEDDYKLVYYLDDKKTLLFNLKQDPGETNNLADRETEISRRLLRVIQSDLETANRKIMERQAELDN